MKALALMLMVALLTACGTVRERVVTKTVEVKVPVATPCVKAKPAVPSYQYGIGPYPGEEAAAVLLASDLEAAKQYGGAWEAAAAGCIVGP